QTSNLYQNSVLSQYHTYVREAPQGPSRRPHHPEVPMPRPARVPGAHRALALAVARALAADGDRVAVTHRSGPAPEGLFGVECDVTDPESVERAFKQVETEQGPVQVLVANAGITRDGMSVTMSDTQFDEVLQTNLHAA